MQPLMLLHWKKCPLEFTPKMSTKLHQKRGILVDNKCPQKFVKNFHENSPYENVILKNSVHKNSLSTRVLHPILMLLLFFINKIKKLRQILGKKITINGL